jgi:hypothetical protein
MADAKQSPSRSKYTVISDIAVGLPVRTFTRDPAIPRTVQGSTTSGRKPRQRELDGPVGRNFLQARAKYVLSSFMRRQSDLYAASQPLHISPTSEELAQDAWTALLPDPDAAAAAPAPVPVPLRPAAEPDPVAQPAPAVLASSVGAGAGAGEEDQEPPEPLSTPLALERSAFEKDVAAVFSPAGAPGGSAGSRGPLRNSYAAKCVFRVAPVRWLTLVVRTGCSRPEATSCLCRPPHLAPVWLAIPC